MQVESPLLQDCIEAAAEAARRAGRVLLEWRHRFSIKEKARFDLVTDADLASQQAVFELLQARFPNFGFIGEEAVHRRPPRQPGLPSWIVDPLDGTTNYVHDFPMYAVSIGLEQGGEPILGVIYDPTRQELYHAGRGLGAWLNGQRLQATKLDRLEDALLCTGFPPDMSGHQHTLDAWQAFSTRTQSIRRSGTTVLNLAYIAAGRVDGYWTHQAHAWDACAGVCLVREAGGTVTNLDSSPFTLSTLDMLASNGPLHPAMRQVLEELHR
jgi:myo-inositol-1(or 4)-monophosphatase